MEKFLKSAFSLKILIVIAFVIDVIGCWDYYSDTSFHLYTWKHLLASLYLTLKIFTLSINIDEKILPLSLNIFRFISPLLLAGVLLNFVSSKAKQFWTYVNISCFYSNHIIFCGLNDNALLLIKDYLGNDSGINIVAIENDENKISIFRIKFPHIKLIRGSALDETKLRKSKIFKAKTVFILNENENFNIQVANSIQKLYLKKSSKKKDELNVLIHLSDFYKIRIFKNFQEKKIPNLDFHSFNFYQKAAAFVVDKYSPDQYVFLNEKSDNVAHILIHGLGISGENVVIESAQMYHFANLKKCHITVVDTDVLDKKQTLLRKYPLLEEVVCIDFYEQTEFFSNGFIQPKDISVCFICDKDDAESFLVARKYRQLFFDQNFQNKLEGEIDDIANDNLLDKPKIVINLTSTPDFLNLFENISSTALKLHINIENLHNRVFSYNQLASDHEVIDDIAKQFHNIYMKLDTKELDKSWEDLTDEGKDCNRFPARHIAIKLRYIGAELVEKSNEQPDFDFGKISSLQKLTLAQMEHSRWCAEKLLTGFIPGKNVFEKDFYQLLKSNLKWHKDIQDWWNLSSADQHKDELLNELKMITSNLKHKKTIDRIK